MEDAKAVAVLLQPDAVSSTQEQEPKILQTRCTRNCSRHSVLEYSNYTEHFTSTRYLLLRVLIHVMVFTSEFKNSLFLKLSDHHLGRAIGRMYSAWR